jgi:RNA polymerase sigma-70 factor, ECF subfamily
VTTVEQQAAEAATQSERTTVDSDVVTDLHRLHGSSLFDFARHQGLTDEQAADVVQEALLRLWRELRRGSAVENPLAWMYRAAYRLAMDQHRWRRRLSGLLPRLAPRHAAYAGPEASDRLTVWASVDELPPRQRQALYLHYAADLTFEDVASVLGISPSAARTHASRGLATLRDRLAIEEMDR